MKTSSYILVALTLSLILVQSYCAKPKQKNNKTSPNPPPSVNKKDPCEDEEYDEDEFFHPDEKNPSMSCILFGEAACSEECRLKAQLYDIKAEGLCYEKGACKCKFYDLSFEQEWNKKFNSAYIRNAILDDELVHKRVEEIFSSNPLRTGEQFKQLFESVITPYQFTKLKVRDNSLAAKFTTEDGQPDNEAVEKYVSENIEKLLKSLRNVQYGKRLTKFLDKVKKSTVYNVTYRIEQMNNQTLKDILEKYLEEKKLEKPEAQLKKQGFNDVFDDTFINGIIKRLDGKNNGTEKSSKSRAVKKSS